MFEKISLGLHRRHLALLVTTASLSLTACGGGGGGGGGSENPDFGNAGAFQTDEFNESQALVRINAAEGYARIPGEVGGEGVQVAIIDDGVDSTHTDLDDNIVFDGAVLPGQTETTEGLGPDGHGTAVAGVIAAEKNDDGFHGVAFNAKIASYDYSSFDPTSLNTTEGADNLNNAALFVDAASGAGDESPGGVSDIMNFSWGFDNVSTDPDDVNDIANPGFADAIEEMGDALARAADRDKILVFAIPNTQNIDTGLLEDFVIDDRIEGLGIAVAAVDENNNLVSAGCSERIEDFCMAAPGTNVDATLPGNVFDEVNGTSFAAPLVAGSAAVVKAAFPGVSNEEIVQRLLDSATPIAGEDVGQGLLNLEAALDPDGDFSVALGTSLDGPRAAFAGSQVSIDSSSALGGDAAKLLGDAIVFDEQNFPFAVDLERNVDRRSRTTGLDSFVGADRGQSTVQTTDYGSVSLAFSDDQRIEDPHRAEFEQSDVDLKEETFDPKVRFQSEIADGVDFFMSLNGTSATDLGLGQSLAADQGSFFQQSAFLAPFEKLAGLQSGGGAAYELDDDTKIAVTAFAAADDEALTEVSMQKVELVHRTVGDIELRAGYGLLQEEGGFLGSSTKGAFGEGTSTDSQYVNVSLKAPLSETVSLFGAYTQGRSSTSAGSSLLNNFSDTRSEAFGAGLVVQDLVKDGDGFSLMVGQPLRVTSGSADVTVAVGRTEDGEVLTETAKADLSPDAREITTEAVYDFSLDGETQSLSTGAFARFNPDNDPDASPDLGFGVKYQLRF